MPRDPHDKCCGAREEIEPLKATYKGKPRLGSTNQRWRKFNALNSSREVSHRESLDKEMKEASITMPKPLRETAKIDKTNYCLYHQSRDHNTKDCYQLRHAIEEIISNGKMTWFTTNTLDGEEQHDQIIEERPTDHEAVDDETPKAKRARIKVALGFTDD